MEQLVNAIIQAEIL